MDQSEPEPQLPVGEVARRCGTTVRTLQYYDRIGLLTADRDPSGRRTYRRWHLARLQQILLLSGAGFGLAEIKTSLDRETDRSPAEVFAAQAELLEIAELRLRCQRVVITAVAEVLRLHPGADVPAEVITAVISVDTTLMRYTEIDWGPDAPELDDTAIQQLITGYFAWKAIAVRAMILLHNAIPPDSDSGRRLGHDHHLASRQLVEQQPELAGLYAGSEQQNDRWPAGDRDLHLYTKEYLDRCEHSHLIHAEPPEPPDRAAPGVASSASSSSPSSAR